MRNAFQEIVDDEINQALEALLLPRLRQLLSEREPGHCMRVSDLSLSLMLALCQRLRQDQPSAQVFILRHNQISTFIPPELCVTSTKLVELRNPLPDGTLRSPLLVFLPPNTRASAEDSFGIATFEDVLLTDVYQELNEQKLDAFPGTLKIYVNDLLKNLREENWPWADVVAQTRFLLTALKNGGDAEVIGASLYTLGLVPDFDILKNPSLLNNRIRKNLESVRQLTYADLSARGRVLQLGLTDKTLQRRLMQLLLEIGLDDPHGWTRQIVVEQRYWDLSFHHWHFTDEAVGQDIAIKGVTLDLPIAEDEDNVRLQDLIGSRVLAPKERRKFNVTFEVAPHPTLVPGLDHFSVQVLRKDSETGAAVSIGVAKKAKVWKAKRTTTTVTLDKLNKVEFDEGWHFIRVLPWTDQNDPIPLASPEAALETEATSKVASNESELFYVLPEADSIEDIPPQRAEQKAESLEHARLRLQFTAISQGQATASVQPEEVLWADKADSKRSVVDTLKIRFGAFGTLQVPIARMLKELEQTILSAPKQMTRWDMQVKRGQVSKLQPVPQSWPPSPVVESFLAARESYFDAVRQGDKNFITQAANFLVLREAGFNYASAYQDLLNDLQTKIEQRVFEDNSLLSAALALDSIHLKIEGFSGTPRETLLLGPTHPLRVLWLVTWAQVSQHWLTAVQSSPPDYLGSVRDALLNDLQPLNLPVALPLPSGQVFTSVDNVHWLWSLYTPAKENDPRGLVSDVCQALNIAEPAIGGAAVTSDDVALRLQRYLLQHPYTPILRLNVFNPGRATLLAEALIALQRQKALAHLRYDVRLFVPDPEASGVGEALEDLLFPSASVNTEAADAFTKDSGSYLFPKLTLSVAQTDAFIKEPETYRAHLSLLFDLFPTTEMGAMPKTAPDEHTPLYGLLQDFVTEFNDSDETGTFWKRYLRRGSPAHLPNGNELANLLALLPATISSAIAAVATGTRTFDQWPVFTVGLTPFQRQLIHQVHTFSDWVFTIDRNMGIEYFDHGRRQNRPDYVIDYTPSLTSNTGHRLVVTTQALTEMEALLQPVLEKHGVRVSAAQGIVVLEQLRALSGRLALKLISASTQQAEVIGLALARLFLASQGVLTNQIVVPVDDHINLFRASQKQADELREATSLNRTDLALFELDYDARAIHCHLVEVKYRDLGSLSAYLQLKQDIAIQIERTEQVLHEHFDPHWKTPDRADRLLKSHEFSVLLNFYLGRAIRHRLMREPVVVKQTQKFLDSLESGFTLSFMRSALIFDFGQPVSIEDENDGGIHFYRLGADTIKTLITQAEKSLTEPVLDDTPFKPNETLPVFEVAPLKSLPSTSPVIPENFTQPTSLVSKEFPASEPEHIPAIVEASLPISDSVLPVVPSPLPTVHYDVMLGATGTSPQYGLLGEVSGKKLAFDLNSPQTISLFGIQGSGKSYSLGSIIEMACLPIPNINILPSPLATVVFHYSQTQDYQPEFTTVVRPNSVADQIAVLRERYGAEPAALKDVVLLTTAAKVAERQSEHPEIQVLPIKFASSELKAIHWRFLMGAVGNQSVYLRQINQVMRTLRDNLTLPRLLEGVENSDLPDKLMEFARLRLQFAAEYIDDAHRLSEIIRPGRLIIVDLRDEFVEKDEALGLFLVLLQIFSEVTHEGQLFSKLVVFDEAHKYIENSDLTTGLVEVVREMRHKRTSIMVASQEPRSVPIALIELSTAIILHRFNSPDWLKHIQRANSSLSALTPEKLSQLSSGEAYLWVGQSTEEQFTRGAVKIRCRPRVTQHGGGTKTAVN